MVRESDGYQGHLVSPEMGLRRMVDETLALVVDPVSTAVRRVHQVLIDAARCGSLCKFAGCWGLPEECQVGSMARVHLSG